MNVLGIGVSERAKTGDPVALCQVMVSIPSVNPELEVGGAGEAAMARQCRDWLEGWGYEVQLLEVATGRWNVVGRMRLGSGGRTLILNGHLDTVGVEGMLLNPFQGEEREGRVWGRGACDMKGGLATILATAASLSTGVRGSPSGSDSSSPGELIIAFTADEEHASVGMQRFVEGVPRADAAVVCEPTSLAVMPAHKGFLWMEADFKGKAAHGSRPDEGVDAILHAALFLAALSGLEGSLKKGIPHPLLGHPSFHAGRIEGGSAPSIYPDRCSLVLERRMLPGESPDEVFGTFQEILQQQQMEVQNLNAEFRPGLFRPGSEVATDSELVQALLGASDAEGLGVRVEGMTAWVDAAFLNEAGIPAVCFGPGSIAQAHSAEEWVAVEELEVGTRVLIRFVRDFLALSS